VHRSCRPRIDVVKSAQDRCQASRQTDPDDEEGRNPKLTDGELVTAVKKVVAGMDNPTPSGVVKAVRASGVSASE
jgi:hypothetical protein